MSDPNTLGRLVRRRRLESGYSLGQLASKVGKTAAEVRAWERDAELPEHGILERLSETLELDLDEIRARLEAADSAKAKEKAAAKAEAKKEKAKAAQEEANAEGAEGDKQEPKKKSAAKKPVQEKDEAMPPQSEEPAEEEAKGEKAKGKKQKAAAAVAPVVAADAATTTDPDADVVAELPVDEAADEPVAADDDSPADAKAAEEDDEPGFAVDDPFTPPAPIKDDAAAAPLEPDLDLLEAPTEAVPVPVITETAKAARAERAVAVLEEPPPLPTVESAPDDDPGLLRYLEPVRLLFDPNSRYLYWIRAGLTVVVMLVFAVILLDQLGKLLDAVGELLDTIEPAATTPDDLDALGPLRP